MLKKLFSLFASFTAQNDLTPVQESFINGAMEGLQLQTSAHSRIWKFGEEESWSVDLDEGKIMFVLPDAVRVEAPIQVIGTYNELDSTFLWGWDHFSIPEALRKHANIARQWGIQNRLQNFMRRKVSCSEEEAWVFTAVAHRLSKANGAYRATSGTTLIFMTFGELKIEKNLK